MGSTAAAAPTNFIRAIIDEDIRNNKHNGQVVTRFPPEPNGYLHIGHAKSICLNFGLAVDYKGRYHLRFDDTNPAKEDIEYVESIMADIRWLGFNWGKHLYYASDYYEQLYQYAIELIKKGKAYVCDLTPDEIKNTRGTLTEPGKNSPNRDRSMEENLKLFERMRAGDFPDGAYVLRAKIDMASPNLNMRDPVIFRIKRAEHHRTGNTWLIYPMYDYAHPLSDAIEGITHSICTLEFEDHRPLYDWCIEQVGTSCHPQQIEFARLNLDFTVMSKRKLLELVENNHVSGWDDPRMPTIIGMRRRGYTPESIRNFCEQIGVTKKDSWIQLSTLENSVREDLNMRAPRVMCVLRPLRVVIENYPEGKMEELDCPYHPDNASMGSRKVPFSRVLYIERDDFMEEPSKKFFRLAPGREVRLRYAYFIRCEKVIKDEKTGEIRELRCTYDPATKGGSAPDGRKVKGTIHWVSADHAREAEARLYDRLFTVPNPIGLAEKEGREFSAYINPKSLEVVPSAWVEPSLVGAAPESRYQFERLGYFCVDRHDSSAGKLVFNRTVTLRDSWAKIEEAEKGF